MQSSMLPRKITLLAALAALLIGYFWVHKPANPAIFLMFGGALLDVLSVTALVIAAGAFGRWALSRIDLTLLSLPERVALEAITGLGIFSLLDLILGLLGLFNVIAQWGVIVIAALISRHMIRDWLRDFAGVIALAARPQTPWTRFLVIICGLLLVIAIPLSLAPPTAWDAMTYHLVIPQRYLAQGAITTYTDNHFLGFPQAVEMLYGTLMSYGRDTAPGLLHFVFGLLGLMAVAGLTRRYANAAAAYMSVFLLLTSYSLWLLFGWPYVDLAILATSAVAIVAAITWRETRLTSWLILMGVLAGFALGIKYTSGGLLIALGVFVAVHEPRRIIRNGLILGGVALLLFLPWMLKGLLLYHNPVYPYFFDGLNWDATRTRIFNTVGQGLIGAPDGWQLPILPIAATIFGVEAAPRYMFTASPWLLTAPLLLIWVWRRLDERTRHFARDGLLLLLPMLAFWMLMAASTEIGAQIRLIVFALPLAAMLGSIAISDLADWPNEPLDIYFMVRAMLVITTVFMLMDAFTEVARTNVDAYSTGEIDRARYEAVNLGLYDAAMRQLETLPDGVTVRFMWEPKSYTCPPTITCIPDVIFDHWSRPLLHDASPDDVFAEWQSAGDDYLLVFDQGYDFWLNNHPHIYEQNRLFPDALARWMTPVWSDNTAYTLYTWRDTPPDLGG